jgi:type I restriction enzyme S subunit
VSDDPKLPAGWVPTTLGEYTRIRTGKLDANAQVPGGQYPFFTCGDDVLSIDNFSFDTEAVLLAGNGDFNVKWYKGKFNAYQRTYVIEPICVDGKFLYYQLKHLLPEVTKGNRGSTVRFIRIGDITGCECGLPPINEQIRLVLEIERQFSRLDAAVAALRRTQANLRRYRAAVLKAACEGRLVPTEAELAKREGRTYESASILLERILAERRSRWEADQLGRFKALRKVPNDNKWKSKYEEPIAPDSALSKLPEGWLWATLSQVSWKASYGTSEKCDYDWPGPVVLRIPNVASGKIDLTDIKHAQKSHEFDETDAITPGDLLIVRTNGSRDLIGRSAVVQESFSTPHLYASYLIRYRLIGELSLLAWMRTIWDSPWNRAQIESLAATTAGQYNVSVGKLNGLPIPVPPADEMQRIATEIDRHTSIIDELEAQVEANLVRAERLRQSILKQAFAGNLAPQDSNDEPARVLLERIQNEREAAHDGPSTTSTGRRKKETAHVS